MERKMSLKKIGLSLVAAFGLSAGMAVLAFAGEAKTDYGPGRFGNTFHRDVGKEII